MLEGKDMRTKFGYRKLAEMPIGGWEDGQNKTYSKDIRCNQRYKR